MLPKLYIIDASGFIFRAFYAIAPLHNKDGFPTNALFGFVRILQKVIKNLQAEYVVAVFDTASKNFRHELSPIYKANRPPCPDDLAKQMPFFREIVDALGIVKFEQVGFEADDLIASIAVDHAKAGGDVCIVTSDKDMMQLVQNFVQIFDPMKDKFYGPKEVTERFGVSPEQIVDYLSLLGDSSDNVKGVPGVGEKTACYLLSKYGTITNILNSLGLIREDRDLRSREKIANSIEENREVLRLNSQLVSVKTEIAVHNYLQKITPKESELTELFTRFEFTSFLDDLKLNKINLEQTITDVSPEELPVTRRMVFLQGEGGIAVINSDQQGACYTPDSPKLRELLIAPDIIKVGCDLKALARAARLPLSGVIFDCRIAAYLLHPDIRSNDIAELLTRYLGKTIDTKQSNLLEVAALVDELAKKLSLDLEKEGLTKLFTELEMPLLLILAEMEIFGVKVDLAQLHEISAQFKVELDKLTTEIYSKAGGEFNINSPKQLSAVLFERLQLPTKGIKKTKTGISTDAAQLEKLEEHHAIVPLLLRYRLLFKLQTTYVETLPTLVNSVTRRIHTSFNQAGTATGRLSSVDPNLQNIPIQGEEAKLIRRAFIAEDGYKLVSADYSQIELRVLAHLSQDPALIDAFSKGEDIHSRTARELLGIDNISADERRLGKTINFGIIYGMGPHRLARELGITFQQATGYIENYFTRFAGVKRYFAEVESAIVSSGRVTTVLGRHRIVNEIDGAGRDGGFAGRAALNAPLQGSAADIIKLAMIAVRKAVSPPTVRLILQVHDELLFEVQNGEVEQSVQLIKKEMEGAYPLLVPLQVDIRAGGSWHDVH